MKGQTPRSSTALALPAIHFNCGGSQYRSSRTDGWDTGWRTLPYTLVEVPEGGSWQLETSDGVLSIGSGETMVMTAGIHHRLVAHCSAPMVSTWLYCLWEVDGVPLQMESKAACIDVISLVGVVDRIGHALESGGTDLATTICLQKEGISLLEQVTSVFSVETVVDERIARVMAYSKENLGRTLSRADLARVAGLSETRFHDVFVQTTGEAPVQYLHRLRLQRATALLSHSDESIGGIAEQCGFTSLYYFSRFFHQHLGCAPSSFRKLRNSGSVSSA